MDPDLVLFSVSESTIFTAIKKEHQDPIILVHTYLQIIKEIQYNDLMIVYFSQYYQGFEVIQGKTIGFLMRLFLT